MLIVTAKVPRRALRVGGVFAALALFAFTLFPAVSALFPTIREASAVTRPNPKGVRTNADRVEYLAAYGWEVSDEPIAVQELLIPAEMDETYQDYLELQTQQGFSLEKQAGKRVKRYTYEVYNYPSGESGVQANLLLYRNTVIAGEVLSPRLDGFLHGLDMP